MRASLAIFRPFLTVINGSATALLRLFGMAPGAHRHLHSPEEIDLLIAESRDGGLLEADEQQRLRRALRLGRRRAEQLMVPLERVTMVDAAATPAELVQRVATSPFTRLPVFRGTRDCIVGLLLVKDVVHRYGTEQADSSVEGLMRPMPRIDRLLAADQILATLRNRRSHQGVVIDERDRAIGIVTVQDVLSQFLGPGTAGERSAPA
jgi:CBS domain containing-hemolysin-like protein